MPDPRPLTGLFGKVPAHGDFVRRGLPSSFVTPWDAWLQGAVAAAREQLGAGWESAWDSAPAWRFALPAGACGPDAVAGVMLPSQDQVGRRFPVTLAALLPADARLPGSDWYDAVEAAALAGRDGRADADALAAAIPPPEGPVPWPAFALPAPFAPSPAMPVAASWEAALPLGAGASPAAGMEAELDVLAMLGAGATEAAAPAPPPGDDALALLLGGTGAAPTAADPMPADGTLAALIGEAPAGPPAEPSPAATDAAGTLEALIGAAPAPAPEAFPAATEAAGTLEALIGAAPALTPDAPAATPAPDADEGDGVLAGLIGAAAPHIGTEDAAPLALSAASEGPGPGDSADLLPETVAAEWPELQDPVAAALPAEAPTAPEGGGWWTRGGAHVPPMVWPLAALPPPSDFAYLLESAA